MGRWLFSVVHPDGTPSVHDGYDLDAIFAAVDALNVQWTAEGRIVFGGGLQPAATARTVTLEPDLRTTLITDGPFVESKEVLGGFWVLEATDDEVEDLARAAARACQTTVEFRAFHPEPDEDA